MFPTIKRVALVFVCQHPSASKSGKLHDLTEVAFVFSHVRWAHHLSLSKDLDAVMQDAYLLLQKHFLHWMEAMCILGLVSETVRIIDLLQAVTHVSIYRKTYMISSLIELE